MSKRSTRRSWTAHWQDVYKRQAVGLLLGETPELIAQGLVSYQASGMRQNIYEQDGYQIYAD